METQLYSLLFLLLLSTISVTNSSPDQAFDYIRSSCNTTLYPDVCYTSLSRYANVVQQDPAHLAVVAIGVSLSRARRASSYFSNLTHRADFGPSPRAASALRDCCSTFGDAVDQMRGSLKQMRQLWSARTGAEEIQFRLGNVQTWMSAALTNEGTCSDGFADVADSPVKANVNDRVASVNMLTSNALALVNSLANSVGS